MKIKDHFLTGESFDLQSTAINGILKTSPVPANLAPYYESKDYISHHQDSGSIKEKVYKILQKINLNYKRNIVAAEIPAKGKILDYGCGAGEFIKYVQKDFTAFGFEPNEAARNAAVTKSGEKAIISDLSDIQDESLNAITLWHVFEHIENQKEMLHLFRNKLRHDGVLIVAVPNPGSFDAHKYKEFWAAWDVPRHLYHFTRSGMTNLMESEKWKVVKVKPLLLDSFYISMLSEKYKKSSLFWLKGAVIGAISNFKASKTGEFSSLIYIIRKNEKIDF